MRIDVIVDFVPSFQRRTSSQMPMRPERVVPKLIFIERSLQTGKRMNLPQIQLRLQRPEKTFDTTTALKAISEVGTDMSRFKSAKHFASWLGLCPGAKISGGKVLSGASKRTANRATKR